MKLAIVKYNAGNTASVANSLRRLGLEPIITGDPETLRSSDKVIFPGVGEASTAMEYLTSNGLDQTIRSLKQPFLGICLGMQLLCEKTDENNVDCLGIIPRHVRKLSVEPLKVPHIGWNTLRNLDSSLFCGISEGSHMYFVHGYFVDAGPETIALAEYGNTFSAAIRHENFYGVQFHPEKSGKGGRNILENFLKL